MAAVKKPAPKLPKSMPLVVSDAPGDANGFNDQGVGAPVPEQSTPQGERTAADILSFSIGRTDDKKQVTGITASLTLAAAPDTGTNYRVGGVLGSCTSFYFEYTITPGLGPDSYLRNTCSGSQKFDAIVTVVVKGNTITWTLPAKSFPAGVTLGQTLDSIKAEARGDVVAAVVPAIDVSHTDKTYKLGA
jgi:hypothetical protein